jgi:hypothetical protein
MTKFENFNLRPVDRIQKLCCNGLEAGFEKAFSPVSMFEHPN